MPTIRIDDFDVPQAERTLLSRLQAICPDYDFEVTLRESEWLSKTIEHVRIFISDHRAEVGAVGGWLLKTLGDVFKDWAKERLKRVPQNTEKLTIYGPENKPAKVITVNKDSIGEWP